MITLTARIIASHSSPLWALSAKNVPHVSRQLRQMTGKEEGSQEGGGEGGQRSVFFFFISCRTTCLINHLLSGSIDASRNVKANDQSGYIGAAIVGGFLLVVVGWYGGQWVAKKLKKRLHEG